MSEEQNQQPQPIPEQQPIVVPEVVVQPVQSTPAPADPPPPKSNRGRYGIGRKGPLETLPQEVKDDMEDHMVKVNPHHACKYMQEKYGEQFPVLKTTSAAAFSLYWKRHNVKQAKEVALQKASAPPPPEILDVINSITNPDISLQDKRQALTALYTSCKARIELMEQRQTNFLDPALEAIILQNKKEQHAILKTISTLQDQLNKESDKDFLGELEIFTQVLLSSVKNTYQLVHQADLTKYFEFMSTLSENFKNDLKSYKAVKEQLKKENS
jgi:hypothetical protein